LRKKQKIKLWSIPECGLSETLTTPECQLTRTHQRRIENVLFHPVADFLLSTSSGNAMTLWDIHKQQELMSKTKKNFFAVYGFFFSAP
jgi:coronin-7